MPSFPLRLPGLNNHVASLECQSMLFFSPHLPTTNKLLDIKVCKCANTTYKQRRKQGV